MAFNVPVNLRLEIISCCVCGVMFGLTEEFNSSLRETLKLWYCPNGHSQSYLGKSMATQIFELEKKNLALSLERDRAETKAAQKGKQLASFKKCKQEKDKKAGRGRSK